MKVLKLLSELCLCYLKSIIVSQLRHNVGTYLINRFIMESCLCKVQFVSVKEYEPAAASSSSAAASTSTIVSREINANFIGRYFESSPMSEARAVRQETPVLAPPVSVVEDFIKLEASDDDCDPISVKQEQEEASQEISIKTEKTDDSIPCDGLGVTSERDSFAASKLEVIFKEEPVGDEASTSGKAGFCVKRESADTTSEQPTPDASTNRNSSEGIKQEKEERVPALLSPRDEERLRRLTLRRPWTKTGLGRELEEGLKRPPPFSLGFRLLSFNILSPAMARRRLFRKRPPAVLDWSRRLRGIQREVDLLRPDIVCLQEAPFSGPTSVQGDIADYFSHQGSGLEKTRV